MQARHAATDRLSGGGPGGGTGTVRTGGVSQRGGAPGATDVRAGRPRHIELPSSIAMPEQTDVVRTYLEITDPGDLRPAAPARLDDVEITRVERPDGAVNFFFYTEVGRHHQWTDHVNRTAAEWQAWAERVETWVATVEGRRAGYCELRPDGEEVEIAYFGLLPPFQGAGLGGRLLTHAITRAFELGTRVWVHTCTLDGPHALANYQARGMRPFREEVLRAGKDLPY
jgi:GNAT superfamily N-acetyltransferase